MNTRGRTEHRNSIILNVVHFRTASKIVCNWVKRRVWRHSLSESETWPPHHLPCRSAPSLLHVTSLHIICSPSTTRRSRAVHIPTRPRAGLAGVQTPARLTDFLFPKSFTLARAHPAPIQDGPVFFPGGKAARAAVDHELSSNTEVKDEWSYTSTVRGQKPLNISHTCDSHKVILWHHSFINIGT